MLGMSAMQCPAPTSALKLVEQDIPAPGVGELLVRVRACGICRTDLHVIDGDIPPATLLSPAMRSLGE